MHLTPKILVVEILLMIRLLLTNSFTFSSLSTITKPSQVRHEQQSFARTLLATFSTTGSSSTSSVSEEYKKRPARVRKSRREKESTIDTSKLEWESFDFSDSPKWDNRFDNGDDIHLASNNEDLEEIAKREEVEDIELQKRFEKQHRVWDNLDLELIERTIDVLVPFIMPDRWERIQDIMSKRTRQSRFLFENPANPSNVWACLRTLDSFGIQHVDVVIQSGRFKGKAALSQKRGMRTAMGSAKWLTLKNHLSTTNALEQIKKDGYHILCTDVNPSSKDIRDMDWDASGKPVCLVMGNEKYGISPEVKEMADESFYLPMVGMAESFNLSVATAITCAHLSAASSHTTDTSGGGEATSQSPDDEAEEIQETEEERKGPLRAGDLPEKEYKTLLLKGALNSINNRTTKAILRKNGIEFPKELNIN